MGTYIIAGILFTALAYALYRIFNNHGGSCGSCNGCEGCRPGNGRYGSCGKHEKKRH